MNCWQCGAPVSVDEQFCGACQTLQPPWPGRTHFERLGVSDTFEQDLEELARQHRKLQRVFHPDRFASRDDRQRRLSLQHATALNDGYRVLKDPCRRADYMLGLRGMDMSDEGKQVKLEPAFLMDVMELREAIEELSGADTHVERGQIEIDVASRYEAKLASLGAGLDGGEVAIVVLAQYAAQIKYLKRILEDLHALAS